MIDLTGMTIPSHLEVLWNRRDEVIVTLQHIKVLRKSILKASQNDPLYLPINLISIHTKLEAAYRELLNAIPYAVCASCQGLENNCLMCKGRGLLSKMKWDVCVPEEMKAIRKAMKC